MTITKEDKTVLFCDTNCDLWHTEADKLPVSVISMPYTIDNEEVFYDLGRKTNIKEFYNKIRKGSMPTTAALNEHNYTEYFEPHLKNGQDIIYLSFSHKLSATFEFMDAAITALKAKYPDRKITCIDTKNISLGAGIIVAEAARIFPNRKSDEEFIAAVGGLIQNARAYFTVENLFHLKRGGRISGVAAVFGSMLNIKPLLCLNTDGKIENFAKAKGRKKSIDALMDKAAGERMDTDRPIYLIDADADDAAVFHDAFKKRFGEQATLRIQSVGPVIGTHCGPGTLGLCFFKK